MITLKSDFLGKPQRVLAFPVDPDDGSGGIGSREDTGRIAGDVPERGEI